MSIAHSSVRMSPKRFGQRSTSNSRGRLRSLEELHGSVVHVEVFESEFRIVLDDFVHDFAPEHARGEHVGLIDRSDLLVAEHSGVESEASDAFDFVAAVLHGVKTDFFLGARNAFAALRLAKVNVTRQFADGEDVETGSL